MPSGVADSLGGPPKLPILSGAPGYETARDALGAVKWALEPREDTALEQARGLESGLNPYQGTSSVSAQKTGATGTGS